MTNKENSQFHSLIQSNNTNSVHGSSEKKNENQDTIQPVTIVLDNGNLIPHLTPLKVQF